MAVGSVEVLSWGDGGVMMKTSQEEESLELLVLFAIFVCFCCIFSFSQESFHRSLTGFWKMLKTANLVSAPTLEFCMWLGGLGSRSQVSDVQQGF